MKHGLEAVASSKSSFLPLFPSLPLPPFSPSFFSSLINKFLRERGTRGGERGRGGGKRKRKRGREKVSEKSSLTIKK
jgi:hypothetical protein